MRRRKKNRFLIIFILVMLVLIAACLIVPNLIINGRSVVTYEDGKIKVIPVFRLMNIVSPNEATDEVQEVSEEETDVPSFTGSVPRIICWGDSLTESIDSKTAYPDVLARLADTTVLNYGVMSEATKHIAMRQGGIQVYTGAFTIPASRTPVSLGLKSDEGKVIFLKYGDAGINPCYICGVEGTLGRDDNGYYYFVRSAEGNSVSVPKGSILVTQGMAQQNPNDVLVIFTGTNDLPTADTISDVINIQRRMINESGCDKYVIVGLTYRGGIDDIDEVNHILADEYGEHFLDIRTYMLEHGLEDAGVAPTAKDREDIKKGEIPSSLRRDYVHGNEKFYEILATQVYKRMVDLMYLPR